MARTWGRSGAEEGALILVFLFLVISGGLALVYAALVIASSLTRPWIRERIYRKRGLRVE